MAKAAGAVYLLFGIAAAVVGAICLFQAFGERGGGCMDLRALFGLLGVGILVVFAAPHAAVGWFVLARSRRGVQWLAVLAALNILVNGGVVAWALSEENWEAVALWSFLVVLNAVVLVVARRPEVRAWTA
jgi:hypothetical protein